MNDAKSDSGRWWGRYQVTLGSATQFRIGPLLLTLQRRDNEWRVLEERQPHNHVHEVEVTPELPLETAAEDATVRRFGVGHDGDGVELSPVMPDRPVVTRPKQPVVVPSDEEVTMYFGAPLWVRLREADGKRLLADVPVTRPKSTFWGANTREGQLCYAARTHGRLTMRDADTLPHRVMTSVRIVNRSTTPLSIERLHLPVAALSIYFAEDGRLWTDSVTLQRDADEEFAELSVEDRPCDAAKGAKRVGEAREVRGANVMVRAFGNFFRF